MQVNAVGSNAPYVIGPDKVPHRHKSKEVAQAHNVSETQPLPLQGDDHQKGVVRHLQQGHFKGVADVRLRINFFDELSAAASAQTHSLAEKQMDTIVQSTRDALSAYPETGDLTEEETAVALETFKQAVNLAKADFLQAESPSQEALLSGVSAAFDTLVAALQAPQQPALALADVEVITDPATAEAAGSVETAEQDPDATAGPGDAMSDFIATLTATFQAGLEELTQALTEANSFGELSPPRGNGVAYDKFLAIYNELRAPGASDPTSLGPQELDVIA